MSARDPETGQFVSGGGGLMWDEDVETVHISNQYKVDASEVDGTTDAAGGQTFRLDGGDQEVLDLSELLDRGEMAHLILAEAEAQTYNNATTTADNTIRGSTVLTSGTDNSAVHGFDSGFSTGVNDGGSMDVLEETQVDFDPLHRVLSPVAYGTFFDSATGTGGAGGKPYAQSRVVYGANGPTFSHRDKVFQPATMTQWNLDDAAMHLDFDAMLAYRVVEV